MPASPFNTPALLDAIVAVVQGLSGMQGTVSTGVPESLPTRVSAFVTVGDLTPRRKATQLLQREARFRVTLGYRVRGAEATAERDLAALVDRFTTALYADPTLGGVATRADLDLAAADSPEYAPIAGQEYRLYPMTVMAAQQQTVP